MKFSPNRVPYVPYLHPSFEIGFSYSGSGDLTEGTQKSPLQLDSVSMPTILWSMCVLKTYCIYIRAILTNPPYAEAMDAQDAIFSRNKGLRNCSYSTVKEIIVYAVGFWIMAMFITAGMLLHMNIPVHDKSSDKTKTNHDKVHDKCMT